MTGLTHIAFANACVLAGAALYNSEVSPGVLVAISIGSLLPDLDTPKSILGRLFWFLASPLEKAVGHRGLTHSLLGIPFYILLSLPLWFLSPAWAYALFAGALSHLAIDTLTKKGIKLLWPTPLQFVLFPSESWRMEVGGIVERLLFIGMLIAIALLIPISQIGAPVLWARYVGDLGRAVKQYRTLEGQQTLWLNGKLKDNTTEQRLEGRWRAVGTSGSALLILVDDAVRSVGSGETHNLRPQHVHLEHGKPLQTAIATVALSGQALNSLNQRIPQSGEHWLFGELTLGAPLAVPQPVGRYATVKAAGQTLALDHARWRELAVFSHLLVTAGEVIVKHRGTTAAPFAATTSSADKTPTVVVPVTLELRRMSDLQVKAGDKIVVGQPLASNDDIASQTQVLNRQMINKQHALLRGVPKDFRRLHEESVIDHHEFLTYQAAAAKADDAVAGLRSERDQLRAQQHVTAQLAGTVTNVRIKQQRGDRLSVELLIATAAPQGAAAPADAPERSATSPGPPQGNTKIPDFAAAKRVIASIYTGHETTLYCGCRYRGSRVDWASCGYQPRKDRQRAARLEWEHVVPAAAFGQSFAEWRDGHPKCGGKKGRKCVAEVRPDYNFMAADLYNLQPAIGEVNGRRSNYSMAMLPGEPREFGSCDVEIASQKIEPRSSIRGDIARTYQYMDWAYPGRGIISDKNQKLFVAWAAEDPVDAWEQERARRIERRQGNRNPFVLKGQAADTAVRAAAQ